MYRPPGPGRRRAARTLVTLFFALAALLLPQAVLAGPAQAAAPPAGSASQYTMTSFTYDSESSMNVYESPDATGFDTVKAPAYTPPSGLLRDPSIFRHSDGFYYVTYTPVTFSQSNNYIGFARSADRQNWTFLGNVTLSLPGISNAWAPEWFVDSDGSVNIIVSLHLNSDPSGVFYPYKITATNASLTSWSTPTRLSGITSSSIDTFVIKVGSTYHAFLKNTSTKSTDFATADSLGGPWTITKTGNFVDLDGEGPNVVQLDNGCYRLFVEAYQQHKSYFMDSCDTFNTWTTPAEIPGLSGTVKHFTVYKETVAGGVTLPVNTTRSFQSVNYPDRYLRTRSDSLGYLDQVSGGSDAATRQSATFTVVPGLADANCYSFRASDGRYLRHFAFRIRSDSDDNTSVFAKDATFCARPGTAAGSVRFESYNFPGRYLRHRNFELWLDPYEATSLFRQDSSFQPVSPWA